LRKNYSRKMHMKRQSFSAERAAVWREERYAESREGGRKRE
jgi:hypothetical protein